MGLEGYSTFVSGLALGILAGHHDGTSCPEFLPTQTELLLVPSFLTTVYWHPQQPGAQRNLSRFKLLLLGIYGHDDRKSHNFN